MLIFRSSRNTLTSPPGRRCRASVLPSRRGERSATGFAARRGRAARRRPGWYNAQTRLRPTPEFPPDVPPECRLPRLRGFLVPPPRRRLALVARAARRRHLPGEGRAGRVLAGAERPLEGRGAGERLLLAGGPRRAGLPDHLPGGQGRAGPALPGPRDREDPVVA